MFDGYLDGAYVGESFAALLRSNLVSPNADGFNFHVGQKLAPNNFDDVDCSGDGFSPCLNVYLFCAAETTLCTPARSSWEVSCLSALS
jgi:hypothetical protein